MEIQPDLELDKLNLDKMIALVHKHTGIAMNCSKKALLQGRIRPHLKKIGISSFEAYIDLLSISKEEVQEFINLVTTNETQFFRTPRVWEFFNKEFLPEWHKKNPGKTLKVWSGASSSGEEIYTIGICCEEFKSKVKDFQYQIHGTDISTNVLKEAEQALYSGRSIENFKNFHPNLFEKYMIKTGDEFKVSPLVTSKVKFSVHNLFNRPKDKNAYDIIFLRNVLIYFTPEDQEKVLTNIGLGLAAEGILIIGESESLNALKVPFSYKFPLIYTKGEMK
jgi:chemotaxis protein methyltransferase CheR